MVMKNIQAGAAWVGILGILMLGSLSLLILTNVIWYLRSYSDAEMNQYLREALESECEGLDEALALLNVIARGSGVSHDDIASFKGTVPAKGGAVRVGHLYLEFRESLALYSVRRARPQSCR